MKLNISPLQKALESLYAALQEYHKQNNDFIRDSCIQRFEYTYELSWKLIKRYLELTEPDSEYIDQLSFSNLIRKANERGLLNSDWTNWKIYREARNNTSHTYNQKTAEDVFAIIPDFYEKALYLYKELLNRQDHNL